MVSDTVVCVHVHCVCACVALPWRLKMNISVPLGVLLIFTKQKIDLPLSNKVNPVSIASALYTAEFPTMMGSTSSKVSNKNCDVSGESIVISTLLVIPLTAVALHSSVSGCPTV